MHNKFTVENKQNSVTITIHRNNPAFSSAVSFTCLDGREKIHLLRLKDNIRKHGVNSVDQIYGFAKTYSKLQPIVVPVHKRYNTNRIGY
jgi:hypothetical protein